MYAKPKKTTITRACGHDEVVASVEQGASRVAWLYHESERRCAACRTASKPNTATAEENTVKTKSKKTTTTKAAKSASPTASAKSAATPKPATAAARFRALILEHKLTDAEIFAAVRKEFQHGAKSIAHVAWYRGQLRRQGHQVPAPVKPNVVVK